MKVRVLKLEAELDNAKAVYLQLQSRVLRLELELSLLNTTEPVENA